MKRKTEIKSNYQLRKEKFLYKLGDKVIYVGGLYNEYKSVCAIILSRSTQRSINYYTIRFEDGKQMEVKETWINSQESIGDNHED